MGKMGKKTQLAAVSEDREVPDYLGRLRANLTTVVNTYSKAEVSRWTGLSDQTLTNLMKEHPGDPWKGAGQLRTFLDLATYMDIPASLWFLEAEEFEAALAKRRPDPFFAPARSRVSSHSGRTASGQTQPAKDTSQFPAKKQSARSERTSQSGASHRCYTHTRDHQGRWVHASRKMYRQQTFRAQCRRPAGRTWCVQEIDLPSTAS